MTLEDCPQYSVALEEVARVVSLTLANATLESTRTVDELADSRLELLVQELSTQLRFNRGVKHGTDYVGDVELWRKAARIAGRLQRIPVRTGVSRDGTEVWASEGP